MILWLTIPVFAEAGTEIAPASEDAYYLVRIPRRDGRLLVGYATRAELGRVLFPTRPDPPRESP